MQLIIGLILLATIDLGGGVCQQTDGTTGMWNGTIADDSGCVTAAEYQQAYSPENLLDVGTITDFDEHDDGTVTLQFGEGIHTRVARNPFDRIASADGHTGPTIGSLWGRFTVL